MVSTLTEYSTFGYSVCVMATKLTSAQRVSLVVLLFMLALVPSTYFITQQDTGILNRAEAPAPQLTSTLPRLNQPNRAPGIQTEDLHGAKLFRAYVAEIVASDYDPFDRLTMTVNNLPRGIKTDCENVLTTGQTAVTCTLKGRPIAAGIFDINIVVTDRAGASSSQTLPLEVAVY